MLIKKVYSQIRNSIRVLRARAKGVTCSGCVILSEGVFFEGRAAVYDGVELRNTYIGLGTYICPGSHMSEVKIGRYTSIGPGVRTAIGRHPMSFTSMHPAFYSTKKQAGFTYASVQCYDEYEGSRVAAGYCIDIGSDVWIGAGAIILQGVSIGTGAVVAAGAVVAKDVPPYAVVAGCPAVVKRFRFSESVIADLLRSAWWDNAEACYAALGPLFNDPEEVIRYAKSRSNVVS